MKVYVPEKPVDLEREKGERKRSPADFLKKYNANLPTGFPRASLPYLKAFRKNYPGTFSGTNSWTLDHHRKKFMDWLPQHLRSLER